MALLLTILVTYFPAAHAVETAVSDDDEDEVGAPVPSSLKTAFPATKQDEACKELGPGESRSVDDLVYYGPQAVARRFEVTKDLKDPKIFHVEIPMRFTGDQSALKEIFGSILTPEQTRDGLQGEIWQMYITKANNCFKRYGSLLKDPDGNQIHLKIVPKSKDAKINAAPVEIAGSGDRPWSDKWLMKVQCSSIIHETLHLTGLTDNYKEEWLKVEYRDYSQTGGPIATAVQWNCRPEYPVTPMNAYAKILPPNWNTYSCYANTPQLQARPTVFKLQDSTNFSCPANYSFWSQDILNEYSWPEFEKAYKKASGTIVYRAKLPDPESLLTRSQVKFITKPFCTRDNDYLRCAQNDYRTKEVEGCVVLPESCKSP